MIKNNATTRIFEFLRVFGKYAARWLYIFVIIAGSAYGFWVWNKYVINASWSDEEKNNYVQEQSLFSFDKKSYEKAKQYLQSKKDNLNNQTKYSGRDLFYPDGF
jgi:hypothetical protein